MAKVKYKIGDIVMIPVSNSLFVFGRLLKDASIAIYTFSSQKVVDVHELIGKEMLFDPGVFDTSITNGEWTIIGNIPFNNSDESWPSPKFIQDVIDPNKYRIYYKGVMTPATVKQVKGLEKQVMYKPDELVKEIKSRLLD